MQSNKNIMKNGANRVNRLQENEFIKIWKEAGIVNIEFKPNIKLDIAASRIIILDRLRFQGDKEYPILCIMDGVKEFPIQAQNHIAKFGVSSAKAVALLYTKCTIYSLILLFKIRFAHNIPIHITQDRQDAIRFLSRYK